MNHVWNQPPPLSPRKTLILHTHKISLPLLLCLLLLILPPEVFAQPPLTSLTPEGADFSTIRWRDVKNVTMGLQKELCSIDRSCSAKDAKKDEECVYNCDFCYCDDQCFQAGDCCLDKYLDAMSDQLVSEPVMDHPDTPYFECVEARFSDYELDPSQNHIRSQRMITSCPTNFDSDLDLKQRCENSGYLSDDVHSTTKTVQNLTDNWPFASRTSSFFYKNRACARCHGETADDDSNLVPFNLEVTCQKMNLAAAGMTPKEMLDFAIREESCSIFLSVPDGFEERKCRLQSPTSEVYTKCNVTGLRTVYDPVLWQACESPFTGLFFGFRRPIYLSVFCYQCQMDYPPPITFTCGYVPGGTTVPFFVLFNPDALELVQKSKPGYCGCEGGYLLDTNTNRCRELTCARGKQLVDSRCESKVKVANGLAYEVSLTLTGAVSEKQTAKMTQDIFPGTDRDSDVNEISQQVKGHFLFLLFNKTFRDFSSDTLLTYGKSHNFSATTTTTTTTTNNNNNNNSTTTTTTATKKTSTFSVSFYAKLLLQHSVVVQDFESKLLAITDNHTWTINVNGVPLDLWSSYNIPPAGQLLKNLAPPNDVTYRPVKDGVSPLPASPNVEPTHYYYYHNSPYSPNSRNFPARNRFDLSFNDETTSDDNTGDDDDEKEGMAFILVKRALQCPRLTFNLSESAEVELIAVNSSADEKGGQTTTTYELRHTGSGETFSLQDFYMSEERGETSVVVYLCADAFLKYLPTVKTTNNVTSIDLFGVGLVVTSYVCLGLSILTLSLTLLTYGLFASLRTLPGKATMGFSSTLLAAIILFLIGGFLDDVTVLCEVVGVATHFFLLSAFTWMVICTAHMYYVFTKLLEHKVAEHETKSRFLVYVLISFLIPAVIVSLTITCNSIYQASKDNDDNNSTDIRSDGDGNRFVTCDAPTDWIGYGAGICYLSNKLSLLLAGVLPIVLACVINLGVFFRAMMALRSMTSQQKLVRKEATNSLLIYVKLSSLTGLNWLPCMIAVFVSNVVLWYLFLILCGLQGVYVFAAFCLNKRVLALYRQRFEPRRSRKDAKKYARPATQGSEGKPDQRMLKEGTDSSTLTTLSSHLDSSESEGKPGRQKLVENTHI